ncbi:phosphatase PAP2 family protein [Microbacterium deminutum]|uniref:phosphatase PAP2 family protein n=1 Tax=Microbacterium deminutum TaxID=344164 RepID=UPI0031E12BF1
MSPARKPALIAPLLIALVVYGAVLVIGLWIVAHPAWSAWELTIVDAVHSAQFPGLDAVALTINAVFGSSGAILVVLIALAWALLLTRAWRPTVRIGVVIAVSWALAELMKVLVHRPRPDSASLVPMSVPHPLTFSYPSGHTAFAAALCCAIVLVMPAGRARRVCIAAAVLIVVVTGWSRVYLGVHYPTDVLASMVVVAVVAVAVDRTLSRPQILRASPDVVAAR